MVGQRVLKARQWQGLSQKQLAGMMGMNSTHLSHIESGRREPSCATLRKLTTALGVSADWLLELRD